MDFELGKKILKNISNIVVGKDDALELLLVALLADGHVLLEDVPGVGKTLITKCLAKSIEGSFYSNAAAPRRDKGIRSGSGIYCRPCLSHP